MKLIDLSQPLWHQCPNCPTHPSVNIETIADHSNGEWHMELLHFTSHTGSHIDAPLHKIAGGPAIDVMPLETFVGRACLIADVRGIEAEAPITPQVLAGALSHETDLRDAIVLICTGWGEMRQRDDNWWYRAPFLDGAGATWLLDQGVRGVGIDHYSIGGAQEPRNGDTHTILLGNGIWIVEELHFPNEAFEAKSPLKFWALPINLQAHSGAWCRPVLEVDA